MPKVGKNIYKRKDGRWEGRFVCERVNGKAKYRSVYASSYKEVKDKLDEAKQYNSNMRFSSPKLVRINDLANCWIRDYSLNLKESSVIKYQNIISNYILPYFNKVYISSITNEQLLEFVNYLRTKGGKKNSGLAPATVSEVITTMNALRMYAIKKGYLINYTTECVCIKREASSIRVFSLYEETQLITYLKNIHAPSALGILICFYTGIRVGELCALTWNDINLIEKTMKIGRTMQRLRVNGKDHKTEIRILEPKTTNSTRIIPLPDDLVESMVQYYTPNSYVLSGDPVKFVEPRVMQKKFKKILKNCNIEDANFHAIRHSFATRCIELGFDIKSLSEILGHSNVTITMNKYVHPSMELKAEHMNKLSSLFDD